MKKIACSKVVAVQLVFVFILGSTALAAKPRPSVDQPLVPHWWERTQLIKKLELSDDQIGRIKEIYKAQARTISQARDTLAGERHQLRRLLSQDVLDDGKVEQQVAALESALSALVKAEMAMHYAMLKELDPDQRKNLIAAIEQQRPPARHTKAKKGELSEKQKLDKRYHRF